MRIPKIPIFRARDAIGTRALVHFVSPYISTYIYVIAGQILEKLKNQKRGTLGNLITFLLGDQRKGWGRVKIYLKHHSAFFITRKTKFKMCPEISKY